MSYISDNYGGFGDRQLLDSLNSIDLSIRSLSAMMQSLEEEKSNCYALYEEALSCFQKITCFQRINSMTVS